ncbi:MAG TPA: glycoside hydrolase family 3 protein [Acidobacteria bacterium]|nr:glycoside hydrolase family 3 protein [Acidobacteriota bacterium]
MSRPDLLPIITGVPGPVLSAEQRKVLEAVRPAGIILFARNIVTPEQVRELTTALDGLEPQPFISVDLEGGAVNRLAGIWGTLPSAARAAAAGRRAVRALGEAAGAACCALGIHLDLAPVVDLETPEGLLGAQKRCFSEDPLRVATLAAVFARGLEQWCVAGCLKHFPGLGAVVPDTHEELPRLDLDHGELTAHLAPFESLSELYGLVMTAHVIVPALGDGERPVSLAPQAVRRAAELPGHPVILGDDLEMGALASFGELPDRAVAALAAGNHGIIVSKAFDQLEAVAERLEEEAAASPRFRQILERATARLGTFQSSLCRASVSVPAPDDATVAQLWEHARNEAEPR